MLVLSRKKNERVVLCDKDGNIYGHVMLVELRSDKARIGFEFHEDLIIHRQEVYDAIQREKAEQDRPGDSDADELAE